MSDIAVRKPFVCEPVARRSFGRSQLVDERRTALREAAYIRRTHFTKAGRTLHDFTMRAEDLFVLLPIVPDNAPWWVSSPYLRWQMADEAADNAGTGDDTRAWHICGDLPPGLSNGQLVDRVEAMTRAALLPGIVAEIAIHMPQYQPNHAHILVASRVVGDRRYGETCTELHERLNIGLHETWNEWLS